MKPKILHIGAGFLGNNVIRQLKLLGYEVEVFDLLFGQDLLDITQLEEAIKRNDYIILNAAVADLNIFEAKPLMGMRTNVYGPILVANFCSKHKKRLYYISTCCTFGNTPDLPSNEESKVDPSEIYACAKLAGEWVIKGYNKSFNLEYIILRLATFYGPEMRDSLAPAVFLGKILSGESIQIHGDGKQTRTLTYVDDIRDGIVAAITHPEIVNETINISSEEELSVMDWIKTISEVVGVLPKFEFGPDRKGQTKRELIDASKAKRLLGWEAKYSFRQGIEATYRWMQEVWEGKW